MLGPRQAPPSSCDVCSLRSGSPLLADVRGRQSWSPLPADFRGRAALRASRAALRAAGPFWAAQLQQGSLDMV